jgi:hypothetical protein
MKHASVPRSKRKPFAHHSTRSGPNSDCRSMVRRNDATKRCIFAKSTLSSEVSVVRERALVDWKRWSSVEALPTGSPGVLKKVLEV